MSTTHLTLEEIGTPRPSASPGSYDWEVPGDWHQGRGAFGGLVMYALISALEDAYGEADQKPLRAVTATMCGPAMTGPSTITCELMRGGSGTDTWRAQLRQDGELRTDVVALFGATRKDRQGEPIAPWLETDVPSPAPWQEVEPSPAVVPPMAPEFSQHMDYRITGNYPFSGSGEHKAQGWIFPKRPGARRGAAFVAALMDAWWPAAYGAISAPRPMATITYTLELVEPIDPQLADHPLYYSSQSPVSRQGFSVEFRELWSSQGQLIGLNQQTVVIIK